MQKTQTTPPEPRTPAIDFDDWAGLAKSDPEAFEIRRREAIEALIECMPEHKRERMRCLQWKIDQVRARAGSPMAACIKISEMMWDSLTGPGGLQEALERLGQPDAPPMPSARILRFEPVARPN
ncbi:MAG TPA: DUF3135 domain-containing protein [Gammaproteobacteria bacterium]|nr:DUF3135 domain-containing protein [Gammaproteobacteria bacterium]